MRKVELMAVVAALVMTCVWARAGLAEMSGGQLVYVPCYSHIYHGLKSRAIDLTITLSVRNIDPKRPLTLTGVDYYDTEGRLALAHLKEPETIGPLKTREFIIQQSDTSGGSGANFLVRWTAPAPTNAPIIEAVMIGSSYQQGISFTSRGVVVEER